MANHTIGADDRAVHAVTLAPNTQDVVTLPTRFAARPVVVVHPGSDAPVYVSTGAAAAVVGGAACRVVWPGFALELDALAQDDTKTIRLISASAATYSVELS